MPNITQLAAAVALSAMLGGCAIPIALPIAAGVVSGVREGIDVKNQIDGVVAASEPVVVELCALEKSQVSVGPKTQGVIDSFCIAPPDSALSLGLAVFRAVMHVQPTVNLPVVHAELDIAKTKDAATAAKEAAWCAANAACSAVSGKSGGQ